MAVRTLISFSSSTGPGTTGAFNPAAERPIIEVGVLTLLLTSVYNGSSKNITAAESPNTNGELGKISSSWILLPLLDVVSKFSEHTLIES